MKDNPIKAGLADDLNAGKEVDRVAIVRAAVCMAGLMFVQTASGFGGSTAEMIEEFHDAVRGAKSLEVVAELSGVYIPAEGRPYHRPRTTFRIAAAEPNLLQFKVLGVGLMIDLPEPLIEAVREEFGEKAVQEYARSTRDQTPRVVADGETVTYLSRINDRYVLEEAPADWRALLGRMAVDPAMSSGGGVAASLLMVLPDTGFAELETVTELGREELNGQTYHVGRLSYQGTEVERIVWMKPGEPPTPFRVIGEHERGTSMVALSHWKFDELSREVTFTPEIDEDAVEASSRMVLSVLNPRDGDPDRPETPDLLDQPAPVIELPPLENDGELIALGGPNQSGPVILDFWATWCAPCIRAMPELIEIAEAYRDHGVQFYAINVRERRSRVESFIAEQKWDVKVLMDPDREAWNAYGIAALPTTVIIDEQGIVRAVYQGYSPWLKAQIRHEIESLLEGRP